MKRVSVVGLGYIGLPTAILCAQSGYQVAGYDIDFDKVKKINSGYSTIIEPEISERLQIVLQNKKFKSTVDLQPADFFLISVPTPFQKSRQKSKKADLTYVLAATQQIAKVLSSGNLVILESTVPVGTTNTLAYLLEKNSGLKLGVDFFVAHCPERVLPGKAFDELVNNDRVIGGVCLQALELAKKFYSKFVKGKLLFTDYKTAEMVKLVENSSRDIQIAFANQIASMCRKSGINPYQVIELANKHPRVKILSPGCGVGGHCLAVDPWFLVQGFPQDSELIKVARKINDKKPEDVIKNVFTKVDQLKVKGISRPKILILGLTFKQDIDDLRQSPALCIAKELIKNGKDLDVAICEPNISRAKLKKMIFFDVKGLLDGIKWADIVLILVKHKDFFSIKDLDLYNKIVIDTCGLLHEIGGSNRMEFKNYKSNNKSHFLRV